MGEESTITDPLSVHLKGIDSGDIWFLKKLVQLEVGAEGGTLAIEGDCTAVGYMTALYRFLQTAEITEEITSVGGWHICHKLGDCGR